MPRLLFINPTDSHGGLGNVRDTAFPPMNLPYLAAVTPPHYQIEVLDENVEPFKFREADIVGITAYTASVHRGYQLAQIYREKGVPTVMGGIHVSMLPQEALQFCDAVVVGEAEKIWPEVLADFEAGRLQKEYRADWPDLTDLPNPRREVLNEDHYGWGSIQTYRGCPMDCAFCSVTAFNGRRFRRRSLDAVIAELKQIPQKRVLIADDNIIGYSNSDLEWTRAFFARIIAEDIRKIFFAQTSILFGEDRELLRLAAKAGLKIVFVGMESVNPETLKSYGKSINLKRLQQDRYLELINRIRTAGIAFLGAFVIGGDEDDRRVFHNTLEFVKAAHIDVLQITKPTPLPGTRLWKELNAANRIFNQNFPEDWKDYRFSRLQFKPAKLSVEEVYEGYAYIKNAYFTFWQSMARTVSTLLTTKDLTATMIAYKFNASYRKAFVESENYEYATRAGLKDKFDPRRQ